MSASSSFRRRASRDTHAAFPSVSSSSRELITELSMGSREEEEQGNVSHGRTHTWVTFFFVFFVFIFFPRWFEMVLTHCDSRAVI